MPPELNMWRRGWVDRGHLRGAFKRDFCMLGGIVWCVCPGDRTILKFRRVTAYYFDASDCRGHWFAALSFNRGSAIHFVGGGVKTIPMIKSGGTMEMW